MIFEENVPLAPLTTFRLGGPARFFVRVQNKEELVQALSFAKEKALKVLLLGGGSNLLVADAGFDGLVIKIELAGIEVHSDSLSAGAGASWDALVERAIAEGLWGLENLSGIPGSVGGAVVQSIGAYGAAVSETLSSVDVYDTQTGETKTLSRQECALGYRDSLFKQQEGRYVVLRATFALSCTARPNLSYKDLAALRGAQSSLLQVREAVLGIRRGKFPDLTKEGTAGSFFKNLILPRAQAEELRVRYREMPLFVMPETDGVKVPLAWLFDHVLQANGMREGGARLFEQQPLVVVADFGSSARDVLALREKIKKLAQETFSLELEEEVKIIF